MGPVLPSNCVWNLTLITPLTCSNLQYLHGADTGKLSLLDTLTNQKGSLVFQLHFKILIETQQQLSTFFLFL